MKVSLPAVMNNKRHFLCFNCHFKITLSAISLKITMMDVLDVLNKLKVSFLLGNLWSHVYSLEMFQSVTEVFLSEAALFKPLLN